MLEKDNFLLESGAILLNLKSETDLTKAMYCLFLYFVIV